MSSSLVDECVAHVYECPRNAQCRLDLAFALEADGEDRRALAEAREATRLVQSYGRAWKTVRRLEEKLGKASEDEDSAYVVTVALEEEVKEEAESDDAALATAADRKAKGNELFGRGQFAEAAEEYGRALDVLNSRGLKDAKIRSNRAACYLNMKQPVSAASEAKLAIEADPDWWKGHWYFGQALLALLTKGTRQHGACSANAERAQEATRAFEACIKTSTLPASKRPEVERTHEAAKAQIMEMAGAGCVIG